MKKLIALLTAAMLLVSLAACGAEQAKPAETAAPETTAAETEPETEAAAPAETEAAAEAAETQEIALGTSCMTMTVPAGFTRQAMTAEDTDDGMVAYYANDDMLVDFDVYHWALASDETIESAAQAEAAEYEAEVAQQEINGLTVYCYNAVEESEGKEYKTVTAMVEDDGYVVEIVFWADGENADDVIAEMLNTLTKTGCREVPEGVIALGTSSLTVKPEAAFVRGELSREDTNDVQVGYFCSEETALDFDVYHWAMADGETLDTIAAAEAEEFEAEVQETEFNGMKVLFYTAVEESKGTEYNTVSYLVQDTDAQGIDYVVEVVFWLDGENAAAEAEAIMATLSK